MQITITCELNARNLEILKQLCKSESENGVYTIHDELAEHHKNALAEPLAEAKPQAKIKPVNEQPKITAQDVKAVCLKMSKAGKQAELKAAFAKFNSKKLSDIAEADYPALMKELGDA